MISSLQTHKTYRFLDADPKFFKYSKSIINISPILSNICNIYFRTKIFSKSLKIVEIIPIYKKIDSCESTNYRPISILSQFHKILKNPSTTDCTNFSQKKFLER